MRNSGIISSKFGRIFFTNRDQQIKVSQFLVSIRRLRTILNVQYIASEDYNNLQHRIKQQAVHVMSSIEQKDRYRHGSMGLGNVGLENILTLMCPYWYFL